MLSRVSAEILEEMNCDYGRGRSWSMVEW